MIDTTILGETAAKCMESLDNYEGLDGGRIVAVCVIVVAEDEPGDLNYTRIYASENAYYRQLGILNAGLDLLQSGAGRE